VSRETYETTVEAGRNWVVLWAAVVRARWRRERRTVRWQARPTLARWRGNAPACAADVAVFATRPGVVVL
jgi:hypothetical protein